MRLLDLVRRFIRDERGMETVEWAVLAALITAGVITAITTLGTHVQTAFTTLSNNTVSH